MQNLDPELYYSKRWEDLTVLDRALTEELQVLKILDNEPIENLTKECGLKVVLGILKLKPATIEARLYLEPEDKHGHSTGAAMFDPGYLTKYGLRPGLFYKVDPNSKIEEGLNYDWGETHDELIEVLKKNKPYLFQEYWDTEE